MHEAHNWGAEHGTTHAFSRGLLPPVVSELHGHLQFLQANLGTSNTNNSQFFVTTKPQVSDAKMAFTTFVRSHTPISQRQNTNTQYAASIHALSTHTHTHTRARASHIPRKQSRVHAFTRECACIQAPARPFHPDHTDARVPARTAPLGRRARGLRARCCGEHGGGWRCSWV